MTKRQEHSDFWKRVAKAELALQRKLGMEFTRHEEAIRKILIEMRASRKPLRAGEFEARRGERWRG